MGVAVKWQHEEDCSGDGNVLLHQHEYPGGDTVLYSFASCYHWEGNG